MAAPAVSRWLGNCSFSPGPLGRAAEGHDMPSPPAPIRIGYCLSLTGPVVGNTRSARLAQDIEVDFLVGCDGSRSVVREQAGTAPRSSAPASDVIAPPSKLATTSCPSTRVNPNKSALHSVVIGALLESFESRCGTTTFSDSAPRCALFV